MNGTHLGNNARKLVTPDLEPDETVVWYDDKHEYIITNRRAIVLGTPQIVGAEYVGPQVWSFSPEDLRRREIVVRRDGSGDIILWERWFRNVMTEGPNKATISFRNVRDVHSVDGLISKLADTKSAGQSTPDSVRTASMGLSIDDVIHWRPIGTPRLTSCGMLMDVIHDEKRLAALTRPENRRLGICFTAGMGLCCLSIPVLVFLASHELFSVQYLFGEISNHPEVAILLGIAFILGSMMFFGWSRALWRQTSNMVRLDR